jgi:hypothetical protein
MVFLILGNFTIREQAQMKKAPELFYSSASSQRPESAAVRQDESGNEGPNRGADRGIIHSLFGRRCADKALHDRGWGNLR